MKTSYVAVKARRAILQRNGLAAACIGLLALSLLLAVLLYRKDQTVVLVPTMPANEMVINTAKVDRDYVERICRDVIGLVYNMSPGTTNYAMDALLRITWPEYYGDMRQQLSELIEDMKHRKYSTVFGIHELAARPDDPSCRVKGQFSTYLGKEQIAQRERTFVVTFKNVAGRLWLLPIKEEEK